MKSSGISRDEWLKALADAGMMDVDDQDALTVVEFAAMMGMTRQSAQRRLDVLVEKGAAMATKKRTTPHRGAVTAYRLIQQPPKKGRNQ